LFVLLYFFLLAIVLSVLLRYTDSDYPFDIFKLFLKYKYPTVHRVSTICYCKYSFISFLLIIDVQNFTDDLFYSISLTCLLWMGLTFNTFKYMYDEFCLIICALLQ
jgi:hypothetical protein